MSHACEFARIGASELKVGTFGRCGLSHVVQSYLVRGLVVTEQLTHAAPYFPVHDVDATVAHYENVLGFRRDYAAGQPTEFAIVSRDGHSIMFRLVPTGTRIAPNEQQGGTWDVFFWVRNARELFDELRTKGAQIAYEPIVQESYGMEEFAVRDRNGYVIGFGQPIVR